MTIEKGDSPQNNVLNKFIAKGGEGQRGILLAVNDKRNQAIILAVNSSFKSQGVEWGNMYLVHEDDPSLYPKQVKRVDKIPDNYTILQEGL